LREEAKRKLSEAKQLKIPKDTLVKLYYEKRLSAPAIAAQLGCSVTPIYNNLKRYHLPRRRATERPHGSPGRKVRTPSKTELQRLYSEQEFSAKEIAQQCNASVQTILRRLKEFGIPLRDKSHRLRIRNRRYPLQHSLSTKIKLSNIQKSYWQNPEHAKKVIRNNRQKPNREEEKLQDLLNKYFPNEWKYVGDGGVVINGFCPDFINCNSKKLIIELFGERWHTRENTPWYQTELGRMMVFASLGFKTLIIWSRELRSPKKVVQKVKTFMEGKHV